MPKQAVSLNDKYTLESGRVFLTGTQALVRLPMMQRQRDQQAGLNTACYVTGYRGSPLGAVDQQMWAARPFLERNNIHFQPGVNEDLGATAVWGTQQLDLFGDSLYDGVFAMWYAKGPGVDRSGDVLRHGNNAGSSKHGGVLLLAGDDHTAKSSTTAHQTDYAFMDAMIPTLAPSGVQEIIDYGLAGWAMSRYSGCWVAMKVVADTADTTASVEIDPGRVEFQIPSDFELPAEGVHLRFPDHPLEQEQRLHQFKIYAALAFAKANNLNRRVFDSTQARLGIVTHGKSYLDVRQALDDLQIDEAKAEQMGIRLYKVGMTWPLEKEGIREFAEGLSEILVIEEKRAVVENQLREQLYNWRADVRPQVVGKHDEEGEALFPSFGEITPAQIARAIGSRIARYRKDEAIEARLAFLDKKERELANAPAPLSRVPYFCSGCPHNSSTVVPEGSRALSGIGCHWLVQFMDRDTETYTQMGGEGVPWVGQSPFSKTDHVFANLGDGTYFHSGLLAVRACVAASVNITFKILYNDAVAMTGGQGHDGPLDPAMISRQLEAEGVRQIVVVTDEPDKYPLGTNWADGITIEHRDSLDAVQKSLRQVKGVTALLYDQTCAAEKRRRRKRGLFPDLPRRVFINDLVCEGCGDCSVQSNCVSVIPLETEFGRKRKIDQSACNKDFSCLKGFCPSFVTIEGGQIRKAIRASQSSSTPQTQEPEGWSGLPDPKVATLDAPYGIVITGIGGTGVVTIGALLGMAAHIEGKGVTVLDMAGLAQKGGAVTSHLRLAPAPEDLHAMRISAGNADLILGCDLVVASGFDCLAKAAKDKTQAVINDHEAMTGDFTRDPDLIFPAESLKQRIAAATGPGRSDFVNATKLATRLLGDSIATNLFMVGYAWQKGLIPLEEASIMEAIALNGTAVESNRQAFLWGRRSAHDPERVAKAFQPARPLPTSQAASLEDMIEQRSSFLTDYQDRRYAERYLALVEKAKAAEQAARPKAHGFTAAVARYGFKMMAIKDEYEVARLHSHADFQKKIEEQFDGDYRVVFHLAPPLLSRLDKDSGLPQKRAFGPWIKPLFKVLANLRGLRGGAFDIFGKTAERKQERELLRRYEAVIDEICGDLSADNHTLAIEIASIPEKIRGFGHIKERHIREAEACEADLLAIFRQKNPPDRQAAE